MGEENANVGLYSEEVLWRICGKSLCSAMFFKTGMAADFLGYWKRRKA